MLGRREIVDGKVGSRTRASLSRSLATWWLVLAYGSLFPPWIHWRTSPSLASGWQLHVADLQGGLRHRDQGRGCDPELRRRQGPDLFIRIIALRPSIPRSWNLVVPYFHYSLNIYGVLMGC